VLWAFVVMPRWGLGNPEKIQPIIASGTMAESDSLESDRVQDGRTLTEISGEKGR